MNGQYYSQSPHQQHHQPPPPPQQYYSSQPAPQPAYPTQQQSYQPPPLPQPSDQEIYLYTLRVAVLHDTLTPSSSTSPSLPSTSSSLSSTTPATATTKSSVFRPSTSSTSDSTTSGGGGAGWTKSLFALPDLFRDPSSSSSSASVKLPTKFPLVLSRLLLQIARSSPPLPPYSSHQYFRPIISGPFLTKFSDPIFQKSLAKNRQAEELILTFGSIASGVLRKDELLQPERWKSVLEECVGLFVRLVRDCLKMKECQEKSVLGKKGGGVSEELLARLDAHCAKLEGSTSVTPMASTTLSSSTTNGGQQPDPFSTPPSIPGLTTNVSEMPFVNLVGLLFGKNQHELQRDVVAMKRLCSEKSLYLDLRHLLNLLASSTYTSSQPSPLSPFPSSYLSSFPTETSFTLFKKRESTSLSSHLFSLISQNPSLRSLDSSSSQVGTSTTAVVEPLASPSLSSATSNRNSIVSLSSSLSSTESLPSSSTTSVSPNPLVFTPPFPLPSYSRLYSLSLSYSLSTLHELPPETPVPLSILSVGLEGLLKEVRERWRVGEEGNGVVRVKELSESWRAGEVPEECLKEILLSPAGVSALYSNNSTCWRITETEELKGILLGLFDALLTRFWEIFEGVLEDSLGFDGVVELLEGVREMECFPKDPWERDTISRIEELSKGISKWFSFAYEEKMTDLDSVQRENDLEPFLKMLGWVEKELKGWEKTFKNGAVVGKIDVPSLFIEVAAPLFVEHLDQSRHALLAAAEQKEGAASDEEILALYRGVGKLRGMYEGFVEGKTLEIDLAKWFEPYIRRWLVTTEGKTVEWVKRAIASDRFEIEDGSEEGHSSSIVDLIASCQSATEFVLRLEWPNQVENARYLTGLSQTIAKSIEQYSNTLEGLFMEELFPRKALEDYDQDANRPSAWLTKAKMVVQGDKRIEPFIFKPVSLVKLNNIQAARKLLDRMYTTLDADNVSAILSQHPPPPPPPPSKSSHQPQPQLQPQKYLFTVKIVLSENLFHSDPHSDRPSKKLLDPFCILSDPSGHRVAKTRTLYETNNPRWDETFDVSVKGDLWLRTTIYHRNLVEDHEIVGRAYIHLDPGAEGGFEDFLTKEVWLQLEGVKGEKLESRLLLRISMEGEKDDIRFYFGRAFRSLKRAEDDMTRTIVDKMEPFVRHYISSSTLKALSKTAFALDIDFDRVRGDFSKATGKISELVRDALNTTTHSGKELADVLDDYHSQQSGGPPVPPKAGGRGEEKEKKKGRGPLTDEEIEDAIGPLFDYFNVTFSVLSATLSPDAWGLVSSRLWKVILTTIENLIVPPLSDKPTEMKLLSEKELEIVFKWLQFLVDFFHLGGQGLPLSTLRNAKFQELSMARMYYDWTPDALCEEAVRSMQRQLTKSASILGRSKSVYNQRNLGTIKAHKIEKQQAELSNSDIILRILRMHPGQSDFIAQQSQTLALARAPRNVSRPQTIQRRPQAGRENSNNRLSRGGGRGGKVPPMPTIPDQHQYR